MVCALCLQELPDGANFCFVCAHPQHARSYEAAKEVRGEVLSRRLGVPPRIDYSLPEGVDLQMVEEWVKRYASDDFTKTGCRPNNCLAHLNRYCARSDCSNCLLKADGVAVLDVQTPTWAETL